MMTLNLFYAVGAAAAVVLLVYLVVALINAESL